jgi:hypothetical protein
MTKVTFCLAPTTAVRCPHCANQCTLLIHKLNAKTPSFYICWFCHAVFQVGKGEVLS